VLVDHYPADAPRVEAWLDERRSSIVTPLAG
jgi:hypothetical protein